MFKISFGNRIKLAREKKQLSQQQLANQLHVTDGTISNYEKGVAYPRCETIKSICDILNIEPNYLFWDDLSDNLKEKIIQENCLDKYNRLNYAGQQKVDEYIDDLLENPKYTKNSTPVIGFGEIAAYGADGTEGDIEPPTEEILD